MLQGFDITRGGVVDDDDGQPDPGAARGLELAQHHVEPAIAGDRNDRRGGCCECSADPAGQAVADRRQAAIGDEMPPGRLRIVQEPGPVAGKPAIGDEDAVCRQRTVELTTEPCHVDRLLIRIEPRRRLLPPCPHPGGNFADVIGARGAGLPGIVGKRFAEIIEPGAGVAPQRYRRRPAAPDLLGEDVEMNQRDRRCGQRVALGRDLAELAAYDQQTIRRLDQLVGDPRIAAEQPDRKPVCAGDATFPAHGVGDRDRLRLGKGKQRLVSRREVDAAADQYQRPLGAGEERGGTGDVGPVGPNTPRRGAQGRRIDREVLGGKVVLAVADVLGDVEQYRARPAGSRHREGTAQEFRDAACQLDADQLLDRRPQYLGLPAFLRHVLPGVRAVGIAGECDHRCPGIQPLDETGH